MAARQAQAIALLRPRRLCEGNRCVERKSRNDRHEQPGPPLLHFGFLQYSLGIA
jgi:hypothetical protein